MIKSIKRVTYVENQGYFTKGFKPRPQGFGNQLYQRKYQGPQTFLKSQSSPTKRYNFESLHYKIFEGQSEAQ